MGEYRRQEDKSKLFVPVVPKGQNETKEDWGTESTTLLTLFQSHSVRWAVS